MGERSAVLFKQDSARATYSDDSSDDDESYELNVNDLKVILRDIATSKGNQEFTTSEAREKKEEEKINRYNSTVIRIKFPNRYVLQGTFTPNETIKHVIEFVQPYLQNSQNDFYLCMLKQLR